MTQVDLNGVSDSPGRRIVIVEDQDKRLVVVEGKPYMLWTVDDVLAERMAVVQLSELGMGSQREIATAFQISGKSIYHYRRIFGVEGSAGLLGEKKGPKSPWKITREVRANILYLFFIERLVTYEQIRARLARWGKEVGITSIREVLLENGLIREVSVFDDLANPAELFHNEETDEQLRLDFDWAEKTAATEARKVRLLPPAGEKTKGDVFGQAAAKPRRYYSPGQRMYLDQLKQGIYSAYAGGLLFAPFLRQYPFFATLMKIIDIPGHEGYSLEELCGTLFYLDVFGFRSMEDFKRVYPEEFGPLIGRSSSPSHFTLRRFLHQVRQRGISEKLIEEFAEMYLREGLARWGVLYIDAHFLPYYGMYPISKGWHGVQKKPMKGSYHFLGVDESFMPWIFLIRSSSEDLLEKIPEMIETAKKVARRSGVGEGQAENLVVLFDREGFSGPLYGYLDGRDRDKQEKRAIFVSWAKYTDKWVYEIPEQHFESQVDVDYEIQKAQRLKYCDAERRMSKYGMIRAVVIERPRDGKRMAIYTNGNIDEISSKRVVQLMCRRWGQENLIKELLGKHFINYMPGYVKESLKEQPLVDNPQLKGLKAKRATLMSELHKLKVKFADKVLKQADDQTNWEEIKRREIALLEEIAVRENDILFLDNEIEGLPEKVPFDQAHRGRKLKKLNYEKKQFLDCIKVYSYTAQKTMCRLLLDHYDKEKELLPALSMIVKRGGHLKLQGDRLCVRLQRFKNPEIDYAARGVCEDINKMEPVTFDKYQLPIWFEVG
jgi:transposase